MGGTRGMLPYSPVAPLPLIIICAGKYDLALSLTFQAAKGTQTLSQCHPVPPCARSSPYSLQWLLPARLVLITELPSDVEGGGNQFGASSLAVLPTMRYPVDVLWHQNLVYNAVCCLLVEIRRWNAEHLAPRPGDSHRKMIERRRFERGLMTGLGAGYGWVRAARCAQQMILAIRHFAQGVPDGNSLTGSAA